MWQHLNENVLAAIMMVVIALVAGVAIIIRIICDHRETMARIQKGIPKPGYEWHVEETTTTEEPTSTKERG